MTKEGKQELTFDALRKIATKLLLEDKGVDPVVFLCGPAGTIIIEIDNEYLRDIDTKETLMHRLTKEICGKDVFKLILISEIWLHKIPEDMSEEEVDELDERGELNKYLEKSEAFQILEITSDHMRMFTQPFIREEDTVTLSGEGSIDDAQSERLRPLQQALYPLE